MQHSSIRRSVGWTRKPFAILAFLGVIAATPNTVAQTIRIDATPSHAIPFDPDKALGTSVDILPSRLMDTIYGPQVLKESLCRLGSHHLPPEHRAHDPSMALESHWRLERFGSPERILHRQRHPHGISAQLLRLRASASRLDRKRRLLRQVFASHRRRRSNLLEKQSLSHEKIHRRRRLAPSSMGHPGFRRTRQTANRRHSHRLGKSIRAKIRRPVLDRQRRHEKTDQGRLDFLSRGRSRERKRWNRHAEAFRCPREDALPAHLDDRILQHLRHARQRRSSQLRRLRRKRNLRGQLHFRQRIH